MIQEAATFESSGCVCVSDDVANLRVAAEELFEESFDAPERDRAQRLAAFAENAEQILASIPNRRTLSPGYYIWIAYVIETVEPAVEMGIWCAPGAIDDQEFIALQVLRLARNEFRRKHPPCPGCGTPLEDCGLSKCPECAIAEMAARRRH